MRIAKHIIFWLFVYGVFSLIIYAYYGNFKVVLIENIIYLSIDIIATYILLYKLLMPFIQTGRVFAYSSRLILLYIAAISVSLSIQFIFFEKESTIVIETLSEQGFHSFLVLSTIFGWAVTLKLINEYGEIKITKLELENQNVKNELKLLKSQINPHFLFNSLNNIDELIYENKNNASHALHKLSGIMRYVLKKSPDDYILLKEELEFVRDYIQLAQYSFREEHFIHLEIVGTVKNQKIPPMLLITPIENTIKHAKKEVNPPAIKIKINIENTQLSLSSRNFIKTTYSDQIKEGIGLQNLKRRLELLYKNNYTLDYFISNNEFVFNLKLTKI